MDFLSESGSLFESHTRPAGETEAPRGKFEYNKALGGLSSGKKL